MFFLFEYIANRLMPLIIAYAQNKFAHPKHFGWANYRKYVMYLSMRYAALLDPLEEREVLLVGKEWVCGEDAQAEAEHARVVQ